MPNKTNTQCKKVNFKRFAVHCFDTLIFLCVFASLLNYVPYQKLFNQAENNEIYYNIYFDLPRQEYQLPNINSAKAEELKSIPGIGDTLAKRIIEYRNITGGFKTFEELLQINGIGEKKLESIKANARL